MGYHISQVDSKFFISKGNCAAALTVIKHRIDLAHLDLEVGINTITLEGVLGVLHWYAEKNKYGDIVSISFCGEKACEVCNEELLFTIIAPYVRAGSYIEMVGEEHEMWRWVFNGQTFKETYPTISWQEQ